MAYAMTNELFAEQMVARKRYQFADQTASIAAQDTGVVGNKWIRVRINVKTFGTLTAADTFTATLRVGTGTAVTNPENVDQKIVTLLTGDVSLVMDLFGASENGFQSWDLTIATASSHTFTADVAVEVC